MSSRCVSLRKGQWSREEDECLKASVSLLGERRWDAIARATGLRRSGKSCRLRWLNYLRPNLKHSPINAEEEQIIVRLHKKWGNKWARIARRLPGRTDNEIKNYWRGCLRKKNTAQQTQDSIISSKLQGICGSPGKNSDDDANDLNDIVKGISLQEDKSEASSSSSGATADDCGGVPDVFIMNPESPYEAHFANWVSLFPSENFEFIGSHCSGFQMDETNVSTTALDCWDSLWQMDLLTFNN